MPYFQRPSVDRTFRAAISPHPGLARPSTPPAPQVPAPSLARAPALPLVDRVTAILALQPAVGDDLFGSQPDAICDVPGVALRAAQPLWKCLTSATIDDVPLLHAEQRGKAGQAIVVPLPLANDDASAGLTLYFHATDLLSVAGDLIPAAQVTFAPARLALAAGAQETVRIQIAVPAGARAGVYAGLVQAVGDPVRAVITLDIDA